MWHSFYRPKRCGGLILRLSSSTFGMFMTRQERTTQLSAGGGGGGGD